ncbi:MAG: hypothetical protein J6O60_01280 [Lachnospiraceae bacterium]|nr:hypothetical protein [Lachnospiraceae bacterium]
MTKIIEIIIKDYLLIFILPAVISIICMRNQAKRKKKESKLNINSFVIKQDLTEWPLLVVWVIMWSVIIIGCRMQHAKNISLFFTVIATIIPVLCILLVIPGFWEKRVCGDEIRIYKFFILTEVYYISDINKVFYGLIGPSTKYCTTKGCFRIENANRGLGCFEKRIQQEIDNNPDHIIQRYQHISNGGLPCFGLKSGDFPFKYVDVPTNNKKGFKKKKVLDTEIMTQKEIDLFIEITDKLKEYNCKIDILVEK